MWTNNLQRNPFDETKEKNKKKTVLYVKDLFAAAWGSDKSSMSPNRWILLLIFYISYLLFGAAIYYHIEHGEEKEARAEELKERIEINGGYIYNSLFAQTLPILLPRL